MGQIVFVPGGLFWTRRRAGVGFRLVVPDTHDYFLPRPGRLSSKSGADMIISCGDLRLVGSYRNCPLSWSWPCGSVGWCCKGCTRTLTIYGVARGLVGGSGVPKSCTRTPTLAGWCSRCCADGVVLGLCSKKLSQNPHGSMGWCSKSWGGARKGCPRIPTARRGGVSKVGVVLQKVVPESPLCTLLQ